jgi:hypothetical protein
MLQCITLNTSTGLEEGVAPEIRESVRGTYVQRTDGKLYVLSLKLASS